VRKDKTWRTHHDHKDFEVVMCDGYQQIRAIKQLDPDKRPAELDETNDELIKKS
jgi:hypothetical protein